MQDNQERILEEFFNVVDNYSNFLESFKSDKDISGYQKYLDMSMKLTIILLDLSNNDENFETSEDFISMLEHVKDLVKQMMYIMKENNYDMVLLEDQKIVVEETKEETNEEITI